MKYCAKQKKIQEVRDFRPSEYFGAIHVDQLEDGIDDSRIDGKYSGNLQYLELFLDCFGIKPKIKKEKQKKGEIKPHHNRNLA